MKAIDENQLYCVREFEFQQNYVATYIMHLYRVQQKLNGLTRTQMN